MSHKKIITNDLGEVQCTQCSSFLPPDSYLINKSRGQPYRACRGCQAENRQRNHKPWMQKIYDKNWKIKNREKVHEIKKREYQRNKDTIRARQNTYAGQEKVKKMRRERLRQKYEPGTMVYYGDLKYKILGSTNRGMKLYRYDIPNPIIVPKRSLSFSRGSPPSTTH